MKKVMAGDPRAWMFFAVALLWAWGEAAADDPDPAPARVVASGERAADSVADLSQLQGPAVPAERVRGGR